MMQTNISINKNSVTQSVILAVATFSSALTWTGLRGFLFGNAGWIMPVIGFFVVSIALSIGWLLMRSKTILLTNLIIILFGFLMVFGFNIVYLSAVLIALILFYYGSKESIEEKDLRIKIKPSKILKAGLPAFLTGIIILVSATYYFSPKSATEFEIPRPLFDSIMKAMPLPSFQADLLSLLKIPGLENVNIDELDLDLENIDLSSVKSILGQELGGGLNLDNLPIDDLSKSLMGSEAEQQDAIYLMVSSIVNDYTTRYANYFAIGMAVGLFFLLKTLSVPFMWLVIFLGWLVFKLLVCMGAIAIHEKSVLQEVIEL